MSTLIKDNGIWKEPEMIYVNDDGIWKEVVGKAVEPVLNHRLYLSSGTFKAPVDGYYHVQAVGGGGSGGVYAQSTDYLGSGGGGGGFCYRKIYLEAGTSVPFTVGSGGAALPSDKDAFGIAGGTTTVTLPGYTLTAKGGERGRYANAGEVLGGSATGGTVNRSGYARGEGNIMPPSGIVAHEHSIGGGPGTPSTSITLGYPPIIGFGGRTGCSGVFGGGGGGGRRGAYGSGAGGSGAVSFTWVDY